MISAMPATMSQPIGMPASMKCMSCPIANIGRCITTPTVTAAQPSRNAQTPFRSAIVSINCTPVPFPCPDSVC